MKKLSFTAGVAAIALAIATIFPAAGVFANKATYDGTNNEVTLRRNVNGVTNNVTNNFTYTITQKSVPASGSATTVPSSATIAFSGVAPDGDKTATETTTIDLKDVNFSKVGDYIYTVTETGSSDPTNYPIDSTNSYDIQISVRYQVDNNNVPNNNVYVATVSIKDNNKTGAAAKVSEATWESGASRTYIEINPVNTTGNLAEKDECFAYTVNIPTGNGVTTGDTFDIVYANTACNANSASSVTAGTAATVYLKHGDSIIIGQKNGVNQLPVGASYTITKSNAGDDYTEKFDGSDATTVTKTTVATTNTTCGDADGCFNKNNVTTLENNRETDPLTGIVTNFWFYIMLLVAGIVGFFIISRRKRDDEEQQQA